MDLMDQKIKHEELWGAEPNATEDELSDIIGSLSRLFSSTYYVNLEQDTYRAVIQLRRVGDVPARGGPGRGRTTRRLPPSM